MIYVGIDPGKRGGITRINRDRSITSVPMPDQFEVFSLLSEWHQDGQIAHVMIEKSQSMPGQSCVAMFNYGLHYGFLQGILVSLRLPHTLIRPQEWQKMMFLGTKKVPNPKARALEAANRIFPQYKFLASLRCKKSHDGMIDSALIAEYCFRRLSGKYNDAV